MLDREKLQVTLIEDSKPYWKTINTMLLLIDEQTFYTTECINRYSPITFEDIKRKIAKKYRANLEDNLQLLKNAKIISYYRGEYDINKDLLNTVKQSIKSIGKLTKNIDYEQIERMFKRNVDLELS